MAIKKTLTLVDNFGKNIEFVDTYIKIVFISGSKDLLTAEISILEAKDGKMLKSQSFRFSLDLNGANFIRQAYEHLKTLPEFAGATDC